MFMNPLRSCSPFSSLQTLGRILCGALCLWSAAKLHAQAGTWPFVYPEDSFEASAKMDLRFLNEVYAGEHGFIRLSEDGESFVRGDGKPIRFWAVNNGGATRRMSDEELARHARFMAKLGVNMGRFHGSINPPGKGTDLFEVDTAEVEAIWRYVAAMKKEGIYTTLSPFWPHNGHMGGWVPSAWGIDGYAGKDGLWAVLYVDERLQQAYKTWVRYLYTTPNAYTGHALKDEPAVGLIQIQNEDGVFFWTFQSIKPELEAKYEQRFYQWLNQKYGSIKAAYARWEGVRLPQDRPEEGHMGLYKTYELTQPQQGGKALRVADETEFLARLQYDFYAEITRFYQEDLGCQQLVNPNNWKAADMARLNDLERWTYTAADVPAVNRYNSPGHTGTNNGWRIDPGHHYQGLSVLKHPDKLPINLKQIKGRPMLVTESGWNLPHRYQAEGPFMVAAYQSLTGVDAYYWFAITDVDYMASPYFPFDQYPDGQYPMNRWTSSAPWGIGMFPANALMFRKGYLQEGEPVVVERRSLRSLWKREVPALVEAAGYDPNRDTGDPLQQAMAGQPLSPLTFLAGPVYTRLEAEADSVQVHPTLPALMDDAHATVHSITGELSLNHGKGQLLLDNPYAQGVAGFWEGGETIELSSLSLRLETPYAVVQAVSMDGLPLAESKTVLVQMGTKWRPTDWKEVAASFDLRGKQVAGYQILNTGQMPWQGDALLGKLNLKNDQIRKAWVLDAAGYEVEALPVQWTAEGVQLTLPPAAMYMVLEAE